jgi:hypothetical protein
MEKVNDTIKYTQAVHRRKELKLGWLAMLLLI